MNQTKAQYFDNQVNEPWASSAFGPEETAKIERMLRQAEVTPGMHILEPGCGTGRLTEILADRVGVGGAVLALDISPEMVEACRSRMAEKKNVQVTCGPLEEAALSTGAFDLAICHNVFPHFDDKRAALETMIRVLKDSGRLIIFHFMNSAAINDLHRKAHESVLEDLMPPASEMERLIEGCGLILECLFDDGDGYLLSARAGGQLHFRAVT